MMAQNRGFIVVFGFVMAVFFLFGPLPARMADHNAIRWLLGPIVCPLVAFGLHVLFPYRPYGNYYARREGLGDLDASDPDAKRLSDLYACPAKSAIALEKSLLPPGAWCYRSRGSLAVAALPEGVAAMNKRPGLRLSVSMLGALGLLFMPLAHEALAQQATFFFDDFNGSSLDASKWKTDIATSGIRFADSVWTFPASAANYGSVTVMDSRLTLANSSPTPSCPLFPLIWTNTAIPAHGDFELEFRMRYASPGYWGDGVRIVTMPSAFEPALGSTEPAKGQYVLMIHQDNVDCKGPNISLLGYPGEGSASLAFDTAWHTFTLRYQDGQSSLYVDGAYFAGPHPTPRPNCIQLGVGEVGCCGDACDCCGCSWTSFSVDYIRVTLLKATAANTSTWGTVKARYR